VTSSSQTPPLVEEEVPFQNTKKLGQKKNIPKPRLTVLARASSSLLDWSERGMSRELQKKKQCDPKETG
jgi:hypothetical protein